MKAKEVKKMMLAGYSHRTWKVLRKQIKRRDKKEMAG